MISQIWSTYSSESQLIRQKVNSGELVDSLLTKGLQWKFFPATGEKSLHVFSSFHLWNLILSHSEIFSFVRKTWRKISSQLIRQKVNWRISWLNVFFLYFCRKLMISEWNRVGIRGWKLEKACRDFSAVARRKFHYKLLINLESTYSPELFFWRISWLSGELVDCLANKLTTFDSSFAKYFALRITFSSTKWDVILCCLADSTGMYRFTQVLTAWRR